MTTDAKRDHFQIWRTDSWDSRDEIRLGSLWGLLASASVWIVQGDGAITHTFRTGLTLHGLPPCAMRSFVVVRGDVGRAINLASSVDWGLLRGPAMNSAMEEEMKMLSMISFFPVAWADATLMAFWKAGEESIASSALPTNITTGSMNAFTNWTKRMRSVGCHIDSGTFNLDGDRHFNFGRQRDHGRRRNRTLACVGSCGRSRVSLEQALVVSGLSRERFEIELSAGC